MVFVGVECNLWVDLGVERRPGELLGVGGDVNVGLFLGKIRKITMLHFFWAE